MKTVSWKLLIALALVIGVVAVVTWEFTSLSKWVSRVLVLAALALNALAAAKKRQTAPDIAA